MPRSRSTVTVETQSGHGKHHAFKVSLEVHVVKRWHSSGNTPPSGWNKQCLRLPVSAHVIVLATAQESTHGLLGAKSEVRQKCEAPARFHVSQAKQKSPACLSELIRTHLQQMELPNSNGYLLFFQKRAGWFVRVKSARWRRS